MRLRPGDRVTLVGVGDAVQADTIAATVVSHDGNRVEVTLDQPLEGASRPLILASGEGESARFIGSEESAGSGTQLPITTLGPWQNAANRRASPRFPTYRPCELIVGSTVTRGHILDLSMEGIAIEAVGWTGERFILRLHVGSGLAEIPCESVSFQETAADLVVVHARFENLTVAEKTAVIELSESIRADFEAAQARLVKPRRRPSRSLRAG